MEDPILAIIFCTVLIALAFSLIARNILTSLPEDRSDSMLSISDCRWGANHNDPDMQYMLGIHYTYGIGTPVNDLKALYWFARAAGNGHGGAKIKIANAFLADKCVPRDIDQALYWLNQQEAADTAKAAQALADKLDKVLHSAHPDGHQNS